MSEFLYPEPLTASIFAPFGQVIETNRATQEGMNDGRFERYTDLATLDFEPPAQARIDVVRCLHPTRLPYRFKVMERHPLGTQAFIPMSEFVFVVVVAARATTVERNDIRAFVSNGRQGINYHRGTWHMPMIATAEGQSFVVIERAGDQPNCDKIQLPDPITLMDLPVTA